MIDYAVLCTAIENWKAGQKPTTAAPPRRAAQPVQQEEEAVEYSAVYDAGELADAADAADAEAAGEAPEAPVDSTVIYQLPDDYEGEGEVVEEDER